MLVVYSGLLSFSLQVDVLIESSTHTLNLKLVLVGDCKTVGSGAVGLFSTTQ